MHRPGTDREFSDLLFESIDETITALLSREVAQALFLHLQRVHSTSKDEIPYRLETLLTALEGIFGRLSSGVICKVIARKFYAKLNLRLHDYPERTLLDYVEEAKIKLRESMVKVPEFEGKNETFEGKDTQERQT